MQCLAVLVHRLPGCGQQARQHGGRRIDTGQVKQNGHKLIPAQPRQRVALAQGTLHVASQHGQQVVARRVAKLVVDGFEAIQIDIGHSQLGLAAHGLRQGQLQPVGQQNPVGQARQQVEMGHVLQLLLVRLALADVVANAQHTHQLAIRGAHGHLGGFQENMAAIAGIGDPLLVAGRAASGHRGAIVVAERIGQLLGHKVVVGFAHNVAFSRTKKPFELRVARQVGAVGIFQPDQVGDGVDQGAQVCALGFQLLLGQPPLADVHHHRHDVIDAAIGFAHMADGQACVHHMAIAVDEAFVHLVAGDLAIQHAVKLGQVGIQIIRMRQLCP